jgi:hypothetical protein
MAYGIPFSPRTIMYEYWKLEELPIGEVSYMTIQRALQDEKYMRKFRPSFYRENLLQGHHSALIYWYPHYVNELYEIAVNRGEFRRFFDKFPPHIKTSFEILFIELCKRLDKIKLSGLKLNHLEEIKFKSHY